MAQLALQAGGGAFTGASLAAIQSNFDDLYAYYGTAAGNPFAKNRFVDGDNGADSNDGLTPTKAFKTIQAAIDASAQGDRIFIKPLEGDSASGDTDPDSYTESLTITAKDGLQIIGCGRGLAQGGQPQLKVGTTTTNPIITVNSFGVGIHNLTINGAGATGGGIKLVSDGATATKDAGGTVISGCHFKNCKSTGAAATGGAIYWTANGSCWYVTINGCEFYDCRAGIVMPGTSNSIPRAVKVLGCRFWSAVNTTVDADIYVAADGILGLVISDCDFGTVDVPAYASSPTAARYISLGAGTAGLITRCMFACVSDPAGTEKTFGAAGTAAIFPTTVRMSGCFGEGVVASADQSLVGRT
jgi:hypothetical protein